MKRLFHFCKFYWNPDGSRTLKTQIKTTQSRVSIISNNLDKIWEPAGIQFYLKSYQVIEHSGLAQQVISNNNRSFLPNQFHNRNKSIPGIHIYLGGNKDNLQSVGQTDGGSCTLNASYQNPGIALDWKKARVYRNALAHEIGHYLGLDHVDSNVQLSCGSLLLETTDNTNENLMTTFSSGNTLAQKQISRTRKIACDYITNWNINSNSCNKY